MTSIAFNTTAANANAFISLPSADSLSKKVNASKNYVSFSFVPKHTSRKSAARLSAIDWDLNMNELEFE